MKEIFRKKSIRILALLMAGVIALVAVNSYRGRASAVFEEKKAMRFGAYTKSHTIDEGTLFIGTYLIHKDAVTEELYEQAKQSASDSGQDVIFYKSEFAAGSWFDIADAGSLEGISTNGTPKDEAELANLYVQYFVGADGILIDIVANEEKNPFDLIDPYDLRRLPEMQALMTTFTSDTSRTSITEEKFLENMNANDGGTVRSGVYYYQLINTFFGLDLSDDLTDQYDEQLKRLYTCYKALKAGENDGEAEIVYSLMSKVDAARRSIVMEKLSQINESALGELYNLCNGSYYTSHGNFKDAKSENAEYGPEWLIQLRNAVSHDFFAENIWQQWFESFMRRLGLGTGSWWNPVSPDYVEEDADEEDEEEKGDAFTPNEGILSSITTCMESCQDTYNAQIVKRLQDQDTVLGHAEYEFCQQVIDGASAAGLSADTMNLKYVGDIKEGIISDKIGELALIEAILLPRAQEAYSSAVTAGESGEYAAAAANGKGEATMENELAIQFAKVENKRSELEYIVDAKRLRCDPEKMADDLKNLLTLSGGWRDAIPEDAFLTKGRLSVDTFGSFLQNQQSLLKNEHDSMKSKLDQLKDKLEELKTKKQAALDDENLSEAEELEVLIQDLQEQIEEEEDRLARQAAEANGLGDAADALLDLGDSMDALANRLLNTAKERIAAKDFDALQNSIAALSSIGDANALKEIKDLLKGSGASASLMADLDAAISQAEESEALVSDASQGKGLDEGGEGSEGAGEGAGDSAGDAGAGDDAGGDAGAGEGAGDAGAGAGEGAGGAGAGEGEGAGAGEGAGGAGSGEGTGGAGSGEGAGGAGAGKTAAGSLSRDALLSIIGSLIGDVDSLQDDQLAIVITALSRFAADGNIPARDLAGELTTAGVARSNPYLYGQFTDDKSKKFVSVQSIGMVKGMRYLYNDSRQRATLTKGGQVYTFTVGSANAQHGGEDLPLKQVAVFKDSVMIASEDAFDIFVCTAQYVPKSAYSVCVTEPVETGAQTLYDAFVNALGGGQ